jgi:hypothetical protein
MRPLSAAQLLAAWERGLGETRWRRALPLLAASSSDSTEGVAVLSVGERDRRLLQLREWVFGSELGSVANCESCGERLEWTVDTASLLAAPASLTEGAFTSDDYEIAFRLPNTLDLEVVGQTTDADVARAALLARCVTSASRGGVAVGPEELPEAVTDALAEKMAEIDPQADVQMDLTCPACEHRWQALFDIESFFWTELQSWAQRILSEVHLLACAYGWREKDILELSAFRRQFYLSLVSG